MQRTHFAIACAYIYNFSSFFGFLGGGGGRRRGAGVTEKVKKTKINEMKFSINS